MCGIFGVVNRGALTQAQRDFLVSAVQCGQVRGIHGTGLMAAKWNSEVVHASAAMTGTEFLNSRKIKPITDVIASARSCIGHNRHATSGAKTDANCHPFQFDHIVGVHNGTVPEYLCNRIDPAKSHEVDSGRIFAALARADDPLDVLNRITYGAYSLVWYDTKTHNLHLARNKERPMSLAVTGNGLYLASELGMLTWLLARHKLDDYQKSPMQFAETDVHTLYTVPLTDLSAVTAEHYTPKEPPTKPVVAATNHVWGKSKAAPKKAANKKSSAPGGVSGVISKFQNSIREIRSGSAGLARPKDAEPEPRYEHRASRYYSDIDKITEEYPSTKTVVQFIKDNLMYVKGEDYPRAFGSMTGESFADGTHSIHGFLTNDIGTKEDRWRAMMRLADVEGDEIMLDVSGELPTWDDVAGGAKPLFPIVEAHIFSYELRPTGEIICIGRPVNTGSPVEMFVSEEDENEATWAEYACGEKYLSALDDAQIAGMWQELSTKFNDDVPF